MSSNLEEKLKELKKLYLKKLADISLSLKILLNSEKINIEEVYFQVHKISGTSGMYGLNELSHISTEFEIYLKEIKEDKSKLQEQELSDKLLKYIEKVETFLSEG